MAPSNVLTVTGSVERREQLKELLAEIEELGAREWHWLALIWVTERFRRHLTLRKRLLEAEFREEAS